jgi:hypothetical protein
MAESLKRSCSVGGQHADAAPNTAIEWDYEIVHPSTFKCLHDSVEVALTNR